MMTDYAYFMVSAIIGVVLPAFAILTGNQTKQMLLKFPERRLRTYKQIIALQLFLVTLVFVSIVLNNDGLAFIGISFFRHPLWLSALIFCCLISIWLINKIEIDSSKMDELASQYKDVIYILPDSEKQYKWAIVMSFVVGICEEVMFRGFLFGQLNQYMPLVAAVIVANLLFAMSHFATRLKNVLSAFLLGVFWSVTYILTDTLWLAIFTHFLIDIYSATIAYKLNTLSVVKNKVLMDT